MVRKQAMCSIAAALLAFTIFDILPIYGEVTCPWCDAGMQTRLLDCVYAGLVSRPQLITMPLQEIDSIRWKISSASDSIRDMPFVIKKVKVDEIFMQTIADAIKRNHQQNNPEMANSISEVAGNCYSSVTGYDPNIVIRDIRRDINEYLKKPTPQQGEDSNPVPNSKVPYPANQNQQNNFQPPLIPPNPDGPPLRPHASKHPFNTRNFPPQYQPTMNGNVYRNNPDPQSNMPLQNNPFNLPASPPVNSFNNPSSVNDPITPPVNPSNSHSFINNGDRPSGDSPPNNYGRQGQTGQDFSRNQAPSDKSSGDPLKNDAESQNNRNLQDGNAIASTASPSQDSKSSDADTLDNPNETTLSSITEVTSEKTTENENSGDEEPCDEKFKIALYETLINDDRFCSYFGNLPTSTTKPAVSKIMNHAFKEYGIQQHYAEFSTFWRFESKTLNKESKAEDWDEVISKICKIIFSRNNLLSNDCDEDGKKMADYILDMLPGNYPATNMVNPIQNDGKYQTSTESNADYSVQEASSVSSTTTNSPAENIFSTDSSAKPENLTFPELLSKLGNLFKGNQSTEQDSSEVPFSEMLSTFETQDYLATLHRAAQKCKSPSGFDFKKFFETMTSVTESIQKNHPDWSRDKCEKQMYSATVAVLTKELQDALKSSNKNSDGQSSSNQPDSSESSNDSQNAQRDYNVSSDDSTDPGTDSDSDSVPQTQQDFNNQESYPDETAPLDIPPSGDQPSPDAGFIQPSNFAPGPANTDYEDFTNENAPLPANQPQNYENTFNQPSAQNFPPQDYPTVPFNRKNTQPFSGNPSFPVNQYEGNHRSPNFAPESGVMNAPNRNFGNNRFQAQNYGPSNPAIPNGEYRQF